jgi:hypothetical protein
MSSPHAFTDDVFISYRHLDNELLDEQGKGWIDNFHERIEIVLSETLGYEPKIWRDPRLPGNAYFADVLEERIKGTAVLISILSPGYLQSDWCMGELHEFCRQANQTGGLLVGDRQRIFKVVKTHIEREAHPQEFQKQLGYEFYEIDKATRKPIAFGQELGRNRDQRYWSKLDDLAWDVKQVLSIINPRAKNSTSIVSVFSQSQGTIYLAQTTRDLTEERDQIKRELQNRGYDILPDKELPLISPNYEETVRECVMRAKLSIHLIGGNYGIIPEGAGSRSIVSLQNEIAAERSRDEAFPRMLWLPVGLNPHEEMQAQFIEHLRTDSATQRGAELLQTPLEELKSIIQLRLTSNDHKPEASPGQSPPKIYLIFDKRDLEGVLPLNDYLTVEKNYQVLLPVIDYEGADDAQAFEIHKDNLMQCDAVLIYYGNANQVWFEYKRRDLKKIVGLDRKNLLSAEAVYVAQPKTAHKQLFNNPEAVVIKDFGDFAPKVLEPFLARIKASGKGADDAGN